MNAKITLVFAHCSVEYNLFLEDLNYANFYILILRIYLLSFLKLGFSR